jgi:hypothetical protein
VDRTCEITRKFDTSTPTVPGAGHGCPLLAYGSWASQATRPHPHLPGIARDHGSGFSADGFTLVGGILVPVQLLLAAARLRLSGAL